MDRIPPLAWIGIAIIIIITILINISLIAMLRAKTQPRKSMPQQRARGFIGAAQDLAKVGKVLRDPFSGERSQLNELSSLVDRLGRSKDAGPGDAGDQEDNRQQER